MKNKSQQKSIRLDNTVIDHIQKMAEEENRTFNNMVETILLNRLKQSEHRIA